MTYPNSRPRLKKLVPSLGVADLERSVAFYREYFGFETVDSYDNEDGEMVWCWLRTGVAELMLQQLDPDQQITLNPAIGQSWVLYLRPDDIEETYQRLRSGGIDVSAIGKTAYGARECFVTDPDGYELWLSEPDSGSGPDDEDEEPDEDVPHALH